MITRFVNAESLDKFAGILPLIGEVGTFLEVTTAPTNKKMLIVGMSLSHTQHS